MINTETSIAYRCPHCSEAVVGKVSVFKAQAGKIRLKCSCGESFMELSLSDDGKVRVAAPCIFCPTPHYYTVARDVFFSGELFELPCNVTGFPACFVGQLDEVSDALDENEKEICRIAAEAGIDLTVQKLSVDENSLKEQLLKLLGALKQEERIICYCEDKSKAQHTLTVSEDGVEVKCTSCGASRFFRARTTLDCEYLSEIDLLYLE